MPESACAQVKRACDACHRRKVKCTGDLTLLPCKNCSQASLKCTYNAVPQKKGPKGSRAKVISELREHQRQTAVASKPKQQFDFTNRPPSPVFSREPNFLPRKLINTCVDFFFDNVYPTQPILNRQRFQKTLADMHHNAEAYSLVVSLCAYMLIQPNMRLPCDLNIKHNPQNIDSAMDLGTTLLAEAIEARRSSSYIECPTSSSVATSFFLFGCYFCLETHNTAYFHLREATTLALVMGMTQEEYYNCDDAIGSVLDRRLYWLLFVTERAYALQMQRPLSLHATIALPNVAPDSDEAVQLSGFNHLVVLFKPFDDTFVGLWNQSIDQASADWIATLQKQLTDALPKFLQSTETQAVDLKTSQQWLRVMIWQLSISNRLLSSASSEHSMTFRYPLELSRDLVSQASSFSQQAMEVHGIGLIKKLFDVACTLIDVMSCVPIEPQSFELGPRDYLQHFIELIAKLRGGRSRYLPLLISKAQDVLPRMYGQTLSLDLPSGLDHSFDQLHVDIGSGMSNGLSSGIRNGLPLGLVDGLDVRLDDEMEDDETISAPNSAIVTHFEKMLHMPRSKSEYSDLIDTQSFGSVDNIPLSPQSSGYST